MLKYKPIVFGTLSFLILLSITSLIIYNKYLFYKEQEMKRLQHAAFTSKSNLENCLYQAESSVKTLGFIVENYGIPEDFDKIAQELIKNSRCTWAIELVENGVITKVYPYETNKVVLGYDILKDSARNKDAFTTINKRGVYFAGPLRLKQGGIGLVGRYPIYRNNTFFGFSAVVIKLESLIESANLNDADSDVSYQLVKINPNTGMQQRYINTDPNFNQKTSVSVDLPLGAWLLNVKAKRPFSAFTMIYTLVLGIILSILGSVFIGYLIYIPQKLKKQVIERTAQVIGQEQTLKDNLNRIELQNQKLKEIGWNQSHLVRAPLARLLGLVNLLKLEKGLSAETKTIILHIEETANEFDNVIREINRQSVNEVNENTMK